MSRFRTADSLAPMDDDVRALMADIDATLAELEKHTESGRAKSAATVAPRDESPVIAAPTPEPPQAPPPVPPIQEAQPAAMPPKAPVANPMDDAGGFLAELEQEANAATGGGNSLAATLAADARRIHDALGRVFQFFNSLCRHANALTPTINRAYRLDTQTVFADVKWRDAATRSRRQSLQEMALLDYVVFRVSLVSPAPITVARRWDQMDAFRKEMHILDLREVEGLEVDGATAQGQVRLLLAADFPVQMTFRANYERNRIDVLTRNLEGFGIAAFTCAASEVTQPFLDGLGRYLLARTNKLPAALNRVHCRAEL